MGSIQKTISNAVGIKNEEEIKQNLTQLKDQASANLKLFKKELEMQYLNPNVISKTEIPGFRAFRYIEQYHVASSSSLSSDLMNTVNKSVDNIFGLAPNSSISNGVKTLLIDGLSTFIGSNEAGESFKKMFFVVPENNAIVRVDLYCWKYFFEAKNIVHNRDTAVAYLLAKSVVDHKTLLADELIFMVSDALSNGVYELSKGNKVYECYEFSLIRNPKDFEQKSLTILLSKDELNSKFKSNIFNTLSEQDRKFKNFCKNYLNNFGNSVITSEVVNETEVQFVGTKSYTLHSGSQLEKSSICAFFGDCLKAPIDNQEIENEGEATHTDIDFLSKLDELNKYNFEAYDLSKVEKTNKIATLREVESYITELMNVLKRINELNQIENNNLK